MPPETAKEIFQGMPEAFRPAAAQGLDLVYQFHITDAEPGDWTVVVRDGQCSVDVGVADDPTVTLTMKEKHWVGLASGQLNPAMAFMTGKIKAKGDLMAAQKMGALFKLA